METAKRIKPNGHSIPETFRADAPEGFFSMTAVQHVTEIEKYIAIEALPYYDTGRRVLCEGGKTHAGECDAGFDRGCLPPGKRAFQYGFF